MMVRACKECPFFGYTVGSLLRGLMEGGGRPGVCTYDAVEDKIIRPDLEDEPEQQRQSVNRMAQRMLIHDSDVVPDGCPLRKHNIVIALVQVH